MTSTIVFASSSLSPVVNNVRTMLLYVIIQNNKHKYNILEEKLSFLGLHEQSGFMLAILIKLIPILPDEVFLRLELDGD